MFNKNLINNLFDVSKMYDLCEKFQKPIQKKQ